MGFSFGDQDLNKIIEILSGDLRKYANQFYLVTVDESWLTKQNGTKGIIPIITDGTFFLHSLRKILLNDGDLLDSDLYHFSKYGASEVSNIHLQWTRQPSFLEKLCSYPEILLSVAYQDGLIHGFQHCYANKAYGDYLQPGYIPDAVHSYNELYEQHIKNESYTYAYYDLGYCNALINIQMFTTKKDTQIAPLFTLNNEYFDDEEQLISFINNSGDQIISEYCKKIVESIPEGTVPHFPPWYC